MSNIKNYAQFIREDMLSPMDSPGFEMTNPESPGQTHQKPASMPTDMDIFSLSGPGKKKKKDETKETKSDEKELDTPTFDSSKVLTFQDFIDSNRD